MHQFRQAVEVNNLYFFFITQNQLKTLKAAKNSADSFNGQTQVVAYIGPRHRQAKSSGAEMLAFQAARQAEQKTGHPRFGRALGQQADQLLIRGELLGHQAHKVFLQYGHGAADFFKPDKRDFAQRCGLQSHGSVAVQTVVYAIPAKDFARQIEAGHLFAAIIADTKGLYRTTADRINRLKWVATVKYIGFYVWVGPAQ